MGLQNLVRGYRLFLATVPDARLRIGGGGPLLTELARLREELSLDGMELRGFVPDHLLAKWYQAADVLVMPSLDGEGFGLPLIESMACGTPALGTPVCAIPEVLSGKPDRILRGITPTDICQGLESLHEQWRKGQIRPNEERQYVMERYSEAVILPHFLEDYGDLRQ